MHLLFFLIKKYVKYEFGIFFVMFKRDIYSLILSLLFTNANEIYNYLTRFHKENIFFFRVNNLHGFKSLSYLGCNLWEELPKP